MKLRDYQQSAIADLWQYYRDRKTDNKTYNALFVSPTGSGKSVIIAAIIKDMIEKFGGLRVLVVTHQKELIQQNYEKLTALYPECDAGIYASSLKRKQTNNKVLFCSIQTVYNKAHQLGEFTLMLVDEAHTIPVHGFGMYNRFIQDMRVICGKFPVIGLTATPYRLDSGYLHTGKNALFDDIAVEVDINALLDSGYLCPVTTKKTGFIIDASSVKKRGGEYITSELATVVDNVTENALSDALPRIDGRKTGLIFCVTVAHAEHVSLWMNAHGKTCAVVSGKTPQGERDRLLAQLRNHEIDCLANVNCLTTGVDVPNIDYLIMLRPTESPGLYYQSIGRGLRLHDSKYNCLVLDYAGNIQRHGPIDNINVTDKGDKKADGEAPVKVCPECESIVHAAVRFCPDCEYEFPPPALKIDNKASNAAILTKDYEPEWRAVDRVIYHLHEGKNGKPNTMRVDYWDDSGLFPIRIASEFICVFHPIGYARHKAASWLKLRGVELGKNEFDVSIDTIGINEPSALLLDARGKYAQIVDYQFSEVKAHATS